MKRIISIIAFCIFFIGFQADLSRAESYTIPDENKPDQTIQKILDNASGPVSITLGGGTYPGFQIWNDETWGNPALGNVEIMGKEGETIIIEGSSSNGVISISGSLSARIPVTLTNLEITGSAPFGIQSEYSNLEIHGCNIHNIIGEGIYVVSASTLKIINSEIHDIHRDDSSEAAVYINACKDVTIGSTQIYNNTNPDHPGYRNFFSGLILTGASNVTISNSKFFKNYTHGMFLGGVSNTTTLSDVTLYANGSSEYTNGGNGFYGSNLGEAGFTNIVSYNNQERGINLSDSDGLYGGSYTTLTFTDGEVSGNNAGGVRVNAYGTSATLSDINIHENTADTNPGGLWIACRGQINLINDLKVNNNTSRDGPGGIWIANWSNVLVKETHVEANQGGDNGGGVYISGGKEDGYLSFDHVFITNNTSGKKGGGMYFALTKNVSAGLNYIEFRGNKVLADSKNTNSDGGGGLYVTFEGLGSDPRSPLGIANCRFINNKGDYGAAAYFNDGCYVSIAGGEVTGTVPYDQVDTTGCSALYFYTSGRVSTNLTDNTTDYDIYFRKNKTDNNPTLDATSSWWGTTDHTIIEKRIYDYLDNSARGRVMTWPFLYAAQTQTDKAPFPYTDCQGTPVPEEPRTGYGTIRGRVMDQADGVTRVGIPGAEVQLYLQGFGIKQLVKSTTTDGHGYYAFNNLDIESYLKGMYPPPLDRIRKRANYTVKASLASISDKALFDDDTREGRSYYKDQEKNNIGVAAGEVVEVNFELESETAKTKKMWIINVLSADSPNNYATSEISIRNYVTALEAGSMSAQEEEGLKRAVEAEQGLVYGYSYADNLADLFLESMGTLVGNLFGEVWSAKSKGDAAIEKVNKSSLSYANKNAIKNSIKKVEYTNEALVKTMSYAVEIVFGQLDGLMDSKTASKITAIIKDFLIKLNSTGFKGQGINVIKKVVSKVVSLFKPILLDGTTASYCKTTSSTIKDIIEPNLLQWPNNNKQQFFHDLQNVRRLQQQIGTDGGQSVENVLALVNATMLENKMQENMEMLSAILNASVVGAEFGKGLKTGSYLFKGAKYLTNAGAIATPLNMMFNTLPKLMNNVARASFGLGTIPMSVGSYTRNAMDIHTMAIDTSPWTVNIDNAADAASTGCDNFLTTMNSQGMDDALQTLTKADATGLLDLFDTLEKEENHLLSITSAVKSADASQKILDFMEIQAKLADVKAGLVGSMADLFLGTDKGVILGKTDPRYQALVLKIKTIINDLKSNLNNIKIRAGRLADSVASGEMPAAIEVTGVEITNPNGENTISASPQTLTIKAFIKNIGSADVSNLGVQLNPSDPDSFGTPSPGMEQIIGGNGTLAKGAQAIATWTIEYTGDLSGGGVWFTVLPMESAGNPINFESFFAMGLISVDSSITDSDSDGMPNAYENLCSLNPDKNDANEDKDGDGLTNYAEWKIGTRADLIDTDSDGLSDGIEIRAENNFFTDPLNPDTDEDGTKDGQDGAPLDFLSTEFSSHGSQSNLIVSQQKIILSKIHNTETITITNSKNEELDWVAAETNPGLIAFSPAAGGDGTNVTISIPLNFDFDFYGSIQSYILIFDVTGSMKKPVKVEVLIHGNEQLKKGDSNGNNEVDLGDSIFALKILTDLVPVTSSYTVPLEAAINGNEKIGIWDAIYDLQTVEVVKSPKK